MANNPSNPPPAPPDKVWFPVLVGRLMLDRRVPLWLKLFPPAAVAYIFLPDFVPGPFDDAAVTAGLLKAFVELAPAEVVAELSRK